MTRARSVVSTVAFVAIAAVTIAVTSDAPSLRAQQGAAGALTGTVRSAEEGPMEGVLVRARRSGSNKTVTVVTDAKGSYTFPRERLEPGRYDVSIRAVKFVLPQPAAADVSAAAPVRLDLALKPANVLELAHQLTDPEWLASYPLDEETKYTAFRDCSRCHSMLRASMSTYTAEQLAWVMKRMVYSAGSSPMTSHTSGSSHGCCGGPLRLW